MTVSATQLLRQLASGIHPGADATPRTGFDSATFSDLLARVRRGEVHPGAPLAVDPRAGVSLSTSQLERLAVATDAAQAAGVASLVASIDGITLRIDVEDRTVTQGPDQLRGALLRDLEAYVDIPPESQHFDPETIFSGGLARTQAPDRWLDGLTQIHNPSLSDLLNRPRAAEFPPDMA